MSAGVLIQKLPAKKPIPIPIHQLCSLYLPQLSRLQMLCK